MEVIKEVVRGFNSTLVRLEGTVFAVIKDTVLLFQFHIGAIRREVEKIVEKEVISFNSTLVRLEEEDRDVPVENRGVSIPHWCD